MRSILFDKTATENGPVAWHQGLTICTKQEIPTEGYGPWSNKDGVPHVQPPVALLKTMVTTRIHLDPTNSNNGALMVIPGSHSTEKSLPQPSWIWSETPPKPANASPATSSSCPLSSCIHQNAVPARAAAASSISNTHPRMHLTPASPGTKPLDKPVSTPILRKGVANPFSIFH
ncbi:MAG: phytanoyl-CoA dioxygenase family protein [Verrucomicrobia bacterium]|nr:phytanoyl-CoA dioxygenase family protein [Verrucomicrobiota bacterium]